MIKCMQKKIQKKQKISLNDPIGLLNTVAALLSLFTLFFAMFNADGLKSLLYIGPFLLHSLSVLISPMQGSRAINPQIGLMVL